MNLMVALNLKMCNVFLDWTSWTEVHQPVSTNPAGNTNQQQNNSDVATHPTPVEPTGNPPPKVLWGFVGTGSWQ